MFRSGPTAVAGQARQGWRKLGDRLPSSRLRVGLGGVQWGSLGPGSAELFFLQG